MNGWIKLVGPEQAVEIYGVRLVGISAETGKHLLFSILFIVGVLLISVALRLLVRVVFQGQQNQRLRFWVRQGIRLTTAIIWVVGLVSIWFDNPARLATAVGLVTAGLAFALQKVVTAIAAYFVILRGRVFTVGDRIVMGGVRGDVLSLGFIQTTIMEMGEPPATQSAEPAMWVHARQYTGRIVTVTNDQIFSEPVYNFTREFPYIWEEMTIPVPYPADHGRAEQILLEVAQRHTVQLSELSEEALREMERRYLLEARDVGIKVYYRLTSNWLEMTVRFITTTHGIRDLKDRMSRDIIKAFQEAGIDIASTTFEIVGLPPLRVRDATGDGRRLPGGFTKRT